MISDAQAEHSVLQDFLTQRRAGDGRKLGKLDHLGRSLRHMSEVVPTLAQCGVDFKSLHTPLEITTRSGTRLCHLFGALAALERDLIRERTEAGLTATRQWGRVGGHPPGQSSQAAATALAVEP